jgi:cytoskeletal protein CcmA (bactofilin family)
VTVTVNQVNAAASATFQNLLDAVNTLASVASNNALTANGGANGSLTTGNAYLNGVFASVTLATPSMRGGNVQTAADLFVTSNVVVGNTTANVKLSNTGLVTGNTTVNTSVVAVGANASLNASTLFLGNSSVNAVLNQSGLTIGNVVVNSTSILIGGSALVTANTRAAVASNGTLVGVRGQINFVAGSNNLGITVTDEAANGQITVSINATAAGSAAAPGSNTSMVYNDQGVFGSDTGFTYNKVTDTLSVPNTVSTAIIQLSNSVHNSLSITTTGTSAQVIDSWLLSTYRVGKYIASVKSNSSNAYAGSELLLLQDGGTAYITEYSLLTSNGVLGAWTANANTTHAVLWFTPLVANSTVKADRTLILA